MNVLALDQGTHATRALIFNEAGEVLYEKSTPISLHRISSQVVEQDANEIIYSVNSVLRILDKLPPGQMPKRAALATQRSSLLAWNKVTMAPLSPVISWQDTRANDYLNLLLSKHENLQAKVKGITGLPVSPHYGASKIRWLLDNHEAVKKCSGEELCIGPLSSFIIQSIIDNSAPVVDHANASRTLLFDLKKQTWNMELCGLFGIEKNLLPECRPILHSFGKIHNTAVELCAVSGDQNAAVFANGTPDKNSAYINLGTGAFIQTFTGSNYTANDSLLTGICLSGPADMYTLEGTVNGAASALDWTMSKYGMEIKSKEFDSIFSTSEKIPFFLNSVGGIGSPYWVSAIEPQWSFAADFKAAFTSAARSIVYLLVRNLFFLKEEKKEIITGIIAGGGLSKSNLLMQLLADVAGLPVVCSGQTEATAKGAAWLAFEHFPAWKLTGDKTYYPQSDTGQAEYKEYIIWLESKLQKFL